MSQLKNRLNALRRQSPAQTVNTPSLQERLQRVRPRTFAKAEKVNAEIKVNAGIKQAPTQQEVAILLGGECVADGVIVVERKLPIDFQHGQYPLSRISGISSVAFNSDATTACESLLFMDTETSGLAGGTGTIVFLLGMARIRNNNIIVRQYFITAFSAEAAMLAHAAQWLGGDETLVSYNGKTFDVPLLATRYRLSRLSDPFTRLNHLDLLHPTRRAFGTVWPNCRLSTVERKLLGFTRSHDLPGAEAPQVWFELVRFGITDRLPAMFEHNYWDLISLAALVPALSHVYENPSVADADILAIARHYLSKGNEQSAYRHLQRNENALTDNGLLQLAWLHRRRNEWWQAVAIWQRLAEQGCTESLERLAKYHEHIDRDYSTALDFTETLLGLDRNSILHHDRKRRLLNKIASGG